jgi:hypothetical protein
MSDAPAWLSESNSNLAGKAAKSAMKNDTVRKAAKDEAGRQITGQSSSKKSGGGSNKQALEDMDADTYAAMKKWHTYLRVLYSVTAILCFAAAAYAINNSGSDIPVIFTSFYVAVFGLMMLFFELGFKFLSRPIALNFGFLYSAAGRFFFLAFMCIMLYNLTLFGKICIGPVCLCGVASIYVLFKFPRFEEYLRKVHYYGTNL